MVLTPSEMMLRLAVGTALGALVGAERSRAGRPAGLRTNLVVAVASTTFMLVSTQFIYYQRYVAGELITVDTSRIAASVVAGVGFLGAGTILRTGLGVQGLTTAATLWLVAAIGLAAGGGMYLEAFAATTVSIVGLVLLRRFEKKEDPLKARRLVVTLDEDAGSGGTVLERLRESGVKVQSTEVDHNLQERRLKLTLDVRLSRAEDADALIPRLAALPGVQRLKIVDPT